jgi:hypothetical protein
MLKQKAVWWQTTGMDRYSRKTYAEGVEVNCRWEQASAEEGRAEGRSTIEDNSTVYVDRDMTPGDVLWLGSADDLTEEELNSQTPERIVGAYPIQNFSSNFNVRRTKFVRIATL